MRVEEISLFFIHQELQSNATKLTVHYVPVVLIDAAVERGAAGVARVHQVLNTNPRRNLESRQGV